MDPKFGPPIFTAASAITEMITVYGYVSQHNVEIEQLAEAIRQCRILEENEMFNPSDGFVVDVWTGRVRLITKDEKLGLLKAMLKAKDKEAKAVRDQIKALEAIKPLPFNWKSYTAARKKRRDKDKGKQE